MSTKPTLSIVVPVYNEAQSVRELWYEIQTALSPLSYTYEVLFVDDGSTDQSVQVIQELARAHEEIGCIEFSRNFGKERATTAGLQHARGHAVVMMDADLQHPPRLLPEFLAAWENGAEVVIGIREDNTDEGIVKRYGSKLFYWVINVIADTQITKQATDYRLLDRAVVEAFNQFTERDRMTRGLIDWLGFRRVIIPFVAPARQFGTASYSVRKLFKLAVTSLVSHSLFPLKLTGYLGVGITILSGCLGLFIFVEKYLLHDPWGLNFSGPAILAVIIVFLVGIVLIGLGLMALYIATIHNEITNRPLYVIRRSTGVLTSEKQTTK